MHISNIKILGASLAPGEIQLLKYSCDLKQLLGDLTGPHWAAFLCVHFYLSQLCIS